MRVIGGEFRSRRLRTLEGRATRPTSDRLRETLFNVLGGELTGKRFVDAYAGSGAVGIEALSRGAAQAVFIENDAVAAEVIRENLKALGIGSRGVVVRKPAVTALAQMMGDIVFLDPPYSDVTEYEAVLSLLGRKPPALVIAEHARRAELKDTYGRLERVRVLHQGSSSLSLYQPGGVTKLVVNGSLQRLGAGRSSLTS